jgi:histidine ammonia-lyase
LDPKKDSALINGTQIQFRHLAVKSSAADALIVLEACRYLIGGNESLKPLTGTKAPFAERLHDLRPFNEKKKKRKKKENKKKKKKKKKKNAKIKKRDKLVATGALRLLLKDSAIIKVMLIAVVYRTL